MLRRTKVALCATLATLALSIGCEQKNKLAALPPPLVTVAPPLRKSVTTYLEYTGITKATASVDLRARVKGILQARLYDERKNRVAKDQPLLVIEEDVYKARVAQAEAKLSEARAGQVKAETSKSREIATAQLALDEAVLLLAKVEDARQRSLVARNAASAQDVDRADANTKKSTAQVQADQASLEQAKTDYDVNILTAKANVAAAKADLENAKIDLGYCRISAPIAGRISRTSVDVGNLVGDGQATVLATIVADDPIYAYISVSEADLLRFRRMAAKGERKDYHEETLPLELGMGDEVGFPHKGSVQYSDPSVDPTTGTIQARGLFSNPEGRILPGLFVRVRVPFEDKPNALLIPERSLVAEDGLQPGEAVVLVADKDDVARRRVIRVGSVVDGMTIVEDGLGTGDRVVIDGLQKARDGEKVRPEPIDPTSLAPSARPANATGSGDGNAPAKTN